MMTLIKQNFHIFKIFCVGALLKKNYYGVFMDMVNFNMFGVYLCI